MNLAPKWAHKAAVLGLEMQLWQLRATAANIVPLDIQQSLERRIREIEEMKD